MYKTLSVLALAATLGCATTQKTLAEKLMEENVCHGKGRVQMMENESLAKQTAENRAITDYVRNCLSSGEQALVFARLKEVDVYVEYSPQTREAIAYNPNAR